MSTDEDVFDEAEAHRYFSTSAFNRTWDLIDQEDRTPVETEEMIHLAHASRWHWGQREDATAENQSVAAWQLSRVYAVAVRAEEARRYGVESLTLATENDLSPFHVGYAHEALARAAALLGEDELRDLHLAAARDEASTIEDQRRRKLLVADLGTIPTD